MRVCERSHKWIVDTFHSKKRSPKAIVNLCLAAEKCGMAQAEFSPQRIGIVGAGAIGGHFAARLIEAGHDVSLLVRDDAIARFRHHGLRYSSQGQPFHTLPVKAYASAAEMGRQDLVLIAVKSQVLPGLAPLLSPLIGRDSVILPVGNGLPWWYFLPTGVRLQDLRLRSVDPAGAIERALPLGQVLGGSIMASCHSPEPGVVVHSSGGRVVIGEPTGGTSDRTLHWSKVLTAAGIETAVSPDIRQAIWLKLLGNICVNPISLLTMSSTDVLLADEGTRKVFRDAMRECIALGSHLGLALEIDVDQRMAQTRSLGAIKTSMLQDMENGRHVELDAIVGAALECANALDLSMPRLETLAALARMRARRAGLYSG